MDSLFEKFSEPENLRKALEYIKPKQGSKYQDQIPDFWGIAIIDEINNVYFEHLSENIRNGKYVAKPCRDFYIPKGSFTTRKILVPYVTDRIIYQAFFNHDILGKIIDQVLCNELVFAHRLDYTGENFLKHYAEQYEAYEINMLQAVQEGFNWELKLDVVGFFDNIDLKKLKYFLSDKNFFGIDDQKLIELLFKMLDVWTYNFKDPEYQNRMGIPQGLQTSGFLSNVYLTFLDKKFKDKQQLDHYYLRYCDDIRVYCQDRKSALAALNLIDHSLGRIGLNLNTKKISLKKITDFENFRNNLIFLSKLVLEKPEPKETVVIKEPHQKKINHKKILPANDIPYLKVDPEKIFSDDRIDEIIEREIDAAIDLEIERMIEKETEAVIDSEIENLGDKLNPTDALQINETKSASSGLEEESRKKASILQSVENSQQPAGKLIEVNEIELNLSNKNIGIKNDKDNDLKLEDEVHFEDLLAKIKKYLEKDSDETLVPEIPRKYISKFKFLLPQQKEKDFTKDVLEIYEKIPDAEQHIFTYLKKNPESDLTFKIVLNRLEDYSSKKDFVFDWYIYHYLWILYWSFTLDEDRWSKLSKLLRNQINNLRNEINNQRRNNWNGKNWYIVFLIIRLLLTGPKRDYGRLPLEKNIEFVLDFIQSAEEAIRNYSQDYRKRELEFYADQYKIAALIGLSRLIHYKSNSLESEENPWLKRNHLNLKILDFFKECLSSDKSEVSSFAIYFIQNSYVLWQLLKDEIEKNYSKYNQRTILYLGQEINIQDKHGSKNEALPIVVEIISTRERYIVKIREHDILPPLLSGKNFGKSLNLNMEEQLFNLFAEFKGNRAELREIRRYSYLLRSALFDGKFENLFKYSEKFGFKFLIDREIFFLPIELLPVESKFLCEERALSRMILNDDSIDEKVEKRELKIKKILLIYDTDKEDPLPHSKKEAKDLKTLFDSSNIEVLVWPTDSNHSDIESLIGLINSEKLDLIHFSSHAVNRVDGKSGWILNHRWRENDIYIFTAEDVEKSENIPALVFANACQSVSIQNWRELNQPNMAKEFLKKGTINYIGTNWNLRDDTSAEFSLIFYNKLISDKLEIGVAMQETRKAIASKDRITALNYVLFGNPMTLVTTD